MYWSILCFCVLNLWVFLFIFLFFCCLFFFFFQAEDGIRDTSVTGVQTCALPILRWLRATGYDVTYVRNITDVDDKIMERARANGESIEQLTARMIDALHTDGARSEERRVGKECRSRWVAYQ